jgi:hypothetical protein
MKTLEEISGRMADSKKFPVIFPVHGKSAGAQVLDGFVAAEQVEEGSQCPSPLALPVL